MVIRYGHVMLSVVCQGLQYRSWMVNASLTQPCISIPTTQETTVVIYDLGGHLRASAATGNNHKASG